MSVRFLILNPWGEGILSTDTRWLAFTLNSNELSFRSLFTLETENALLYSVTGIMQVSAYTEKCSDYCAFNSNKAISSSSRDTSNTFVLLDAEGKEQLPDFNHGEGSGGRTLEAGILTEKGTFLNQGCRAPLAEKVSFFPITLDFAKAWSTSISQQHC